MALIGFWMRCVMRQGLKGFAQYLLGLSVAPEGVGFRSCADYNKEGRASSALN
jgi:hypothetical protein